MLTAQIQELIKPKQELNAPVAVAATTTSSTAPSSKISTLLGDANLDGTADAKDTLAVQLHADNVTFLSGQGLINSDVTGEGKTNGIDALIISQYSANLITKFPKVDGSTLLLGDANGDGQVNIGDARMISNYTADTNKILGRLLDNADVNGDGKINNTDAILVTQCVGRVITSFPRGGCIMNSRSTSGLTDDISFASILNSISKTLLRIIK